MTLAERMERPRHGFDWLRLALASGVLVWHSASLTCGSASAALAGARWPTALSALCVPGFFAVSGFLVAASAERAEPRVFFAFRILRVIPALAAVVVLSALVLGPAVTTLTAHDYFRRPRTWLYLLNIVGMEDHFLPMVFATNPNRGVNGSLWTISRELICYLVLGLAAMAGAPRSRRHWLCVAVAGYLILPLWDAAVVGHQRGEMSSAVLFSCFLCGTTIYLWRDRIPYSLPLAASSVAAAFLLNFLGLLGFAALPVAYAVVVFGLIDAKPLKVDLSYGVYLSAYPIQQLLIWSGLGAAMWSNLLLALPLSVAYALTSWVLIEGPIQRRKRRLALLITRRSTSTFMASPKARPSSR